MPKNQSTIRQHRAKLGMNQSELANLLIVSVDTIKRWESKETAPRIDQVNKIAKVLDCKVKDLLADY